MHITLHAYNFEASGNNLMKVIHTTCSEAGVIMWVQLLEGPLPTKFWRAKTSKIGTIYNKFRL